MMSERELERLDILAALEDLLEKITGTGVRGEAMRRGAKRAMNVVEDRDVIR